MDVPPFENPLRPYPCPACRRERIPGGEPDAVCRRCGADLTLCDALRLKAHALRTQGLRRIGSSPREAERLLRASLILESHPAAHNGLAVAALRLGHPQETLARIRTMLALGRK